jgi:hypothetical protein
MDWNTSISDSVSGYSFFGRDRLHRHHDYTPHPLILTTALYCTHSCQGLSQGIGKSPGICPRNQLVASLWSHATGFFPGASPYGARSKSNDSWDVGGLGCGCGWGWGRMCGVGLGGRGGVGHFDRGPESQTRTSHNYVDERVPATQWQSLPRCSGSLKESSANETLRVFGIATRVLLANLNSALLHVLTL